MINTRQDWIKAGFEILKSKGISGVKVETMARKLGVSKGGFYGYFLNREAFLQAMLDSWEDMHSTQIIEYINRLTGDLTNKLQNLLYMVDDDKYDATESSMYYWATNDASAERVVMRVVSERLAFLTNLFIEEGFSQEEAENRAEIFHHFIAGCRPFRTLLPKSGSPERHAQLDHFIKLVTAPAGSIED